MEVEVLFYGKVSEAIGMSSARYQDIKDTVELSEHLASVFPQLKNLQYSIAVNQVVFKDVTSLTNGDVIAILPPFAGG